MKAELLSEELLKSKKEDDADIERAESEGMIQKEWTDEELIQILLEDLLNGSTPG